MLQAIDIRKKYGDNEILKGVTVRVDKGEVVAVIGRSGSGKSTLLRCLNHLETIDSGEIRIDGQPMVTTGADNTAQYAADCSASPARTALVSPNILWQVGFPRRRSSLSMHGRSSWISE